MVMCSVVCLCCWWADIDVYACPPTKRRTGKSEKEEDEEEEGGGETKQ